jgi:hypothetical protein
MPIFIINCTAVSSESRMINSERGVFSRPPRSGYKRNSWLRGWKAPKRASCNGSGVMPHVLAVCRPISSQGIGEAYGRGAQVAGPRMCRRFICARRSAGMPEAPMVEEFSHFKVAHYPARVGATAGARPGLIGTSWSL